MKTTTRELLERANILDVISPYVKLRKAGRNYVGLCPFHKEKTPSFTVSVEKQIYYCFGCHEGGDAINFLMKYDNASFQDALEGLAKQYGVEIIKKRSKKTGSLDGLMKLAEYYNKNLKESKSARQYLSARGIGIDAIDEFFLGYSGKTRRGIQAFLKSASISSDLLINTGVLRAKDGEIYDIFRGRIIIPIMDVNKKVTGFGGRTMDKDGFPKYINSPESSVFSKRTSLFGIDKTRRFITEQNEVILVEGYFDFIALYMAGIRNVISTLGTAVAEGQLIRLRNYTENVVLMLDGDEAGIKSALRLMGIFAEMDINGTMVVLPDGHDPDSYLHEKGVQGIKEIIGTKKPLLDYYFDFCVKKWGLKKIENKMTFIRSVMPHIETIKSAVKKRLYVKRLSELTGVEEQFFWGEIKMENTLLENPPVSPTTNHIGKKVIGALLSRSDLFNTIKERGVIDRVTDDTVKDILLRMDSYIKENGHLEITGFVNVLDGTELKDLTLKGIFDVSDCDEEELGVIVEDYIRHIGKIFVRDEAKRITERLSEAEKRGDEGAILELLEEKKRVLADMKNN